MRVLTSSILLVSVGCLSEARFNEKYAEKKCEEFERCVTSGGSCGELGTGSTTTADPVECEFDKAAARECLRGVWTCDDQFEGYEFPIPPSACASVCGTVGTATPVDTDAAI